MKYIILLSPQLLFSLLLLGQAPCPPINVQTNPSMAQNPNAPSPEFINAFNWFQSSNGELLNLPVQGLSNYYSTNEIYF